MDIPNKSTFEILEERKKYLLLKKQQNNKNGYINAEIGALDRIINFTKLFLNNFPGETIEKMINEYELNNTNNNDTEELIDENGYEILYTYEKDIAKNYKINISFMQQNNYKCILFETKKYIKGKYRWENRGKYKITPKALEEVLKKWNEMETNFSEL